MPASASWSVQRRNCLTRESLQKYSELLCNQRGRMVPLLACVFANQPTRRMSYFSCRRCRIGRLFFTLFSSFAVTSRTLHLVAYSVACRGIIPDYDLCQVSTGPKRTWTLRRRRIATPNSAQGSYLKDGEPSTQLCSRMRRAREMDALLRGVSPTNPLTRSVYKKGELPSDSVR